MLIGHSQGNLFANAAYDGYLAYSRRTGAAAGEDTGYVAAQVVHIAPASAILKGPHVLAAIDLVIDALRRVNGAGVAANTLSIGVMPPSSIDRSGHFLIETYLDPSRPAREEIRRLLIKSMDML